MAMGEIYLSPTRMTRGTPCTTNNLRKGGLTVGFVYIIYSIISIKRIQYQFLSGGTMYFDYG